MERNLVRIDASSGTATHLLIWLHGLGGDGEEWTHTLMSMLLSKPELAGVELLMPTALTHSVVRLQGAEATAWWNVGPGTNFEWMADSVAAVHALLKTKLATGRFAADHVFLGGWWAAKACENQT